MSQPEANNSFILDGRQGHNPADGWRVEKLTDAQITVEGLRLAMKPSPPVPLKDDAGTFGSLENPTGLAVASDGALYISDSNTHRIFKLVRREGLKSRAQFFRIAGGPYANERFVYVPTANRIERWPRALGRDPRTYSEVEVICETVWNETQARKVILSFISGQTAHDSGQPCCASCGEGCGCTGKTKKDGGKDQDCAETQVKIEARIEKEWTDFYPPELPAGEACRTSIAYLPCLGGKGREPRQFDEPRGLAVSRCGDLYVADTRNHRIQIFALCGLALRAVWGRRAGAADLHAPVAEDACAPVIEQRIKLGQPIAGSEPGQFDEPWDVAVDAEGRHVYIADKGNHRVQRYDARTRRFEAIDGTVLSAHFFQVLYGPSAQDRFVYVPARGRLERWPHALGHDPLNIDEAEIINTDVASTAQARQIVLGVLDAEGADDILAEWKRGYPNALAAFPQPEPPFSSPTHLALDQAGRLYVVDADTDYVKFLDRAGRVLGRVEFADEVGGRFRPTAVAVDADGKLLLACGCGAHRFDVEGERSYYDAFYAAWRERCTGLAVDGAGAIFSVGGAGVAELTAPSGFLKQGTYISRAIDSDIENCQWHKLLVTAPGEVPEGTSYTVKTYTNALELTPSDIQALADEEWLTNQTNADDFLVMSGPGRYLWLKIELLGNGVATPTMPGLRADFPRLTYLQYLPAVYQADAVSRDFLERFLSIFESIFGSIEETIDNIAQIFDADGSPAAPRDFLSWLGGWVDMVFEPGWSVETRRSLLRHAPELYRKRGTPDGLKLLLRLALGLEVRIIEHFQLRRWLWLSSQSVFGDGSQLWGNCIVNRLQLDEHARIGDFALTGTGDPVRDPFFVYAHKFSVYVQAALIRSESVERMLHYLVEQEKPAHTQFDLVKVEPRFRVGMQSTIGIDTQVGVYPHLVLNQCATLGYDTLLNCECTNEQGRAMLQVGAAGRVGVGAVVG